jgi:hypothetical protein
VAKLLMEVEEAAAAEAVAVQTAGKTCHHKFKK